MTAIAVAAPSAVDFRRFGVALLAVLTISIGVAFAPTAAEVETSPVGVIVPDAVSEFVFAGDAEAWGWGDTWNAVKSAASSAVKWGGAGAVGGTVVGCAVGAIGGPPGCVAGGSTGAVVGTVGGASAGWVYGWYKYAWNCGCT